MSYQPPEEYKHLCKITVIGEEGVGKTQLLNSWIEHQFTMDCPKTIGVEFKTKMLVTQSGKVKFQIWDTAGDKIHRAIITSYLRGSHIIFIVLSADDTKQKKIDQINEWQKLITSYRTEQIKVIIIETKTDLPGAVALTEDDLEQFHGNYAFHQIYSSKTSVGVDTLENNLKTTVEQLIEPSRNIEAISASPLSINVNNLSDDQAKMILMSLKNLLIHGPLNEASKSYQMSFFGGGRKVIGENGITYTVPDHADEWITKIHLALTNNYLQSSSLGTEASPPQLDIPTVKILLSQLFQQFNETALKKSFSRSSTTQDFYQNCLPNFIKYCVTTVYPHNDQQNYFILRKKISKLDNDVAIQLLQQIQHYLENGPVFLDKRTSYQISFFGGKKHTSSNGVTIRVPDHIASILNYITPANGPNPQEKLLTVYHYFIIAQNSKCSSRVGSTQSFYDSLPASIATLINQVNTNNSDLRPPAGLS